ncbi:unnamed protein product [Closterium sp. NIES-53]
MPGNELPRLFSVPGLESTTSAPESANTALPSTGTVTPTAGREYDAEKTVVQCRGTDAVAEHGSGASDQCRLREGERGTAGAGGADGGVEEEEEGWVPIGQELELRPGDVLYIPRGYPHEAWTPKEAWRPNEACILPAAHSSEKGKAAESQQPAFATARAEAREHAAAAMAPSLHLTFALELDSPYTYVLLLVTLWRCVVLCCAVLCCAVLLHPTL